MIFCEQGTSIQLKYVYVDWQIEGRDPGDQPPPLLGPHLHFKDQRTRNLCGVPTLERSLDPPLIQVYIEIY